MKYTSLALLGALLAASATPVLAASDLNVPVASTAPSTDPGADETTFSPAAVAELGWNDATAKAADEPTTARVTTDGKFLYVRFDASQSERVVSAPPVDGKSDGDMVAVDLWPAGSGGPLYRFAASPDGSSSASASAGTAPTMAASGSVYPGGYTVVMKIPLAQLRGAQGSGSWNVQFARTIKASGAQLVWSHGDSMAPADDLAQAGTMELPPAVARN